MKRVLTVFASVLLLCVLGACDGGEKTSTDEQQSLNEQPSAANPLPEVATKNNVKPDYGGRIVIGTIGEPTNLISALSNDSASKEITSQLYIGLLKYDKDLEIVPWAAESYDVEEGGTLLRFRLRKGIQWEDGTELTADDVEFTYRMMIDPKTPTAYASDFLAVKEFRKIDKYTVEVRYEKPFARSLITWMSDILPKHKLEGQDLVTTPLLRKPVGSGPYKLKEWVPGSRVVLEANDSYFEGRPYIDEVVYRNIPDLATMFLELKAGKLDMMGLTPQQFKFQSNGGEWDANWQKFRYLSFGYAYLGYNLERAPFNELNVRRALSYGIDRKALIAGVLLGEGRTTVGPYKPETWVYNDKLDEYPYDIAEARRLLAQAGFTDSDGNGVVERDGQPFVFTILTNQGNDQRIKAATIIQSQLKQVGVDVRIRTVEWAAFVKEFVEKGRFDAVLLGWNILQDPDIFMVWHSSQAVAGGLNFTKYRNPEVDSLLEQARSVLDQESRKPLYDEVQRILDYEQPYSFLYVPYALPIVHARFKGVEPAPAGLTHNFTKWWVPAGMQRYKAASGRAASNDETKKN
ncbi:peptide-binding protein [Oleidesulfovibrio sp.]|uniref:peptide-binding protein n=1 Tax=Oleidesulfovibrio sp. TaxID=2909707 RepID=UPI003A85F3CF